MLLATTNQLCQEVAVVPFLWILPLSLYLLTFIICFDRPRWYDRRWAGPALVLSLPLATHLLLKGIHLKLAWQILGYSWVLFICCMACHGELVRTKPAPAHLTLFYLCVAAGGALGGFLVAVVAPSLFPHYWEFHVALAAAVILVFFLWIRSRAWTNLVRHSALVVAPLVLVAMLLVVVLVGALVSNHLHTLVRVRNFYGAVTVYDLKHPLGPCRRMIHGRILHGIQFQVDELRKGPNGYDGATSGPALATAHHPARETGEPLRIAVLGLGTGTLAVFGRKGDHMTFYEINPQVVQLAREYFTYLDDTPAKVEVRLGDARLQLALEEQSGDAPRYDIIIFDAFTSDAIPIHLITRESIALYEKRLKPDGLLVFNISNRYLDLHPVLRGFSEQLNWQALPTYAESDLEQGLMPSRWVTLTRNQAFMDHQKIKEARVPWDSEDIVLWTDDFASLWQVLKRPARAPRK
jgi:hypothetical protein